MSFNGRRLVPLHGELEVEGDELDEVEGRILSLPNHGCVLDLARNWRGPDAEVAMRCVSGRGRQYENVAPNDAAACQGSESFLRPRPISPSTSPSLPRFCWLQPNTKPGRAREEVSVSVLRDRTPEVDEPSPYSTL
jgi:hypothetical protein